MKKEGDIIEKCAICFEDDHETSECAFNGESETVRRAGDGSLHPLVRCLREEIERMKWQEQRANNCGLYEIRYYFQNAIHRLEGLCADIEKAPNAESRDGGGPA